MINIINMSLKNEIMTLKNLIKVRQMALNDRKFGIEKLPDTLVKCGGPQGSILGITFQTLIVL